MHQKSKLRHFLLANGVALLAAIPLRSLAADNEPHPFSDGVALAEAVRLYAEADAAAKPQKKAAAEAILQKYEPGLTMSALENAPDDANYPYLRLLVKTQGGANAAMTFPAGVDFKSFGTGGAALFIADLAQEAAVEQLAATLLQYFKDHENLQLVLPGTYHFLLNNQTSTSAQDFVARLKPKLNDDLRNLPDNLKPFIEKTYPAPDIRAYTIEVVLSGAKGVVEKQPLPDIVESVAEAGVSYAAKDTAATLDAVKKANRIVALAGFLSRALKTDDGKGWHTSNDLTQAIKREPGFPAAWLGLAMLQDKNASVRFAKHNDPNTEYNVDLKVVIKPATLAGFTELRKAVETIGQGADNFRAGGNQAKATALKNIVSAFAAAVPNGWRTIVGDDMPADDVKKMQDVMGSLQAVIDLYTDLNDRDYGQAAYDVVSAATYWYANTDSDSNGAKALATVLSYQQFLTNLAAAKTTQDQADVIKRALPSDDVTLKFRSRRLWALEIYAGGGVGYTRLSGDQNGVKSARNTVTLSPVAQVGLEHSWGDFSWNKVDPTKPDADSEKRKLDPKRWSLGSVAVFVPLVDLGAMTSYDLTHSNPAPDTSWSNVFAPGLYAVFGLKHPPLLFIPRDRLRISIGGQYGPRLQKVDLANGNTLTRRAWQAPKVEISLDLWTHILTKTPSR